MIYLNNITEEQEVFIPKVSVHREVWRVTFYIKSTISSDSFSFDGVVSNCSALYYPMIVMLPEDIMPGEYEYTLSDEVGILSTGLLVIGGHESMLEYNNDIRYEQYRE